MKYEKFNEDISPYYRLLSYDEKFKEDGEWFDDCIQYADGQFGNDHKYLTKLDVNYAIAKGKNGVKIYNDLMKARGINFKDSVPDDILKRKNYDILSPIFKSIVGEQQKRHLNIIAKDSSPYNINMRKKKNLDLYQEFARVNFQKPIMDQVNMEIMLKYNIADPKLLNPEEQDQVNSEIQALLKFKTPKDIDKFMREDYVSPTETQLQEIANWALAEFNIKFVTDESFKHLFLSGREISYTTIQNYKPIAKILNPKGFSYISKDNTFFIGEGEVWRYEEYITFSEFIKTIPIDSNILEKLKEISGTHGLSSLSDNRKIIRGEPPGVITEVLANYNIETSGGLAQAVPSDLGSREGQSFLSKLYSMYGNQSLYQDKIRKVNTCYTSLDKGYLVERIDEKTDKLKFYWVGENYETNPELDFRITEYWFPAYYQADSLGYMRNFVYNKKRVEFQNRSVLDPYDIIPPYDGIEYSRLFNNAEITAPLDFGKTLQDEYNLVKEKIAELDDTNIGNIVLLPETFIPDNETTEVWLERVKKHKLGIINAEVNSVNPAIAAQILKSVNLSNNNDIAGYQGRLREIKYEAEQVMCYSPSSLGQAPASMTATANQQNIIQTSYKTEDIFSLHDIFISRFVNNIVLTIKNAMNHNVELREALLSIPSLAALNIDYDLLAASVPSISFINKTNEVDNLKGLKNLLQPMIQNQVIKDMSPIVKIQFMDNPASLINLAEDEERKAEERVKEAMLNEQQAQKDERDLRDKMHQREMDIRKYEIDMKAKTTEIASENQSAQFERQADSNRDKVPDSVEVANIKAQSEIEKSKLLLEIEKLKIQQQRESDKQSVSK